MKQDPICCNKYGLRRLLKDGDVEVRMTLECRGPFIKSNPKRKETDDKYLQFDFIFLDSKMAEMFYKSLKDNKLKFVERYTGWLQEEGTVIPSKNEESWPDKHLHYYEQKPRWPSHTMTGGRS